MTTLQHIGREIHFRKTNFFLGLAGILLATTLFVVFFSAGEASKRETTRLMRDIGLNIRVIPQETDMDKFWVNGFSQYSMPEHYINDLADHQGISYNHLTATLQKNILWADRKIILTGIAPEMSSTGESNSPVTFSIKPGSVYVGFELAVNLGLTPGNGIEIEGRPFTIARCLPEAGSRDDIRIYGHLKDVQAVLNMPGRINEIKALECLSPGEYVYVESLNQVRAQIREVLPDAKVILMRSIATARQEQRIMAERYFAYVLPLLLITAMAWVGILAYLNVRERKHEIGILRALGYGSGKIARLFLGKAAMMGFIGAAVGFWLGTALSVKFGPQIFKVTASAIKPHMGLFIWLILAVPLVCTAAVFIPTLLGIHQDPAIILREKHT